jgi:hypothetical protein
MLAIQERTVRLRKIRERTAKTQYGKFETNISRKGVAQKVCLFCSRKIYGPILRICKSLTDMNMAIGTEATQFVFWENTNGIFVAVRERNCVRKYVAN